MSQSQQQDPTCAVTPGIQRSCLGLSFMVYIDKIQANPPYAYQNKTQACIHLKKCNKTFKISTKIIEIKKKKVIIWIV